MATENLGARGEPVHQTLTPQAALSLLVTHVLEMESASIERIAIGIAGGREAANPPWPVSWSVC
ncbi:hypothetical protein PSQ19_18900 [Devosia algicola]|uniref:Uncharacterized protein n=1 Tax=Devosia algicola TaxID=3026418 RepID=A0ABY7YMU0_9HYPH|nr:hypothetical protein [Devosia algicola]WDR02618.1 hypothetical protein PSQ19_18900 [Devosia algicola]